jgi:hypothetical protein
VGKSVGLLLVWTVGLLVILAVGCLVVDLTVG